MIENYCSEIGSFYNCWDDILLVNVGFDDKKDGIFPLFYDIFLLFKSKTLLFLLTSIFYL